MIRVYARVNGKLALWFANTQDHQEAIEMVRAEVGKNHVVLALFERNSTHLPSDNTSVNR